LVLALLGLKGRSNMTIFLTAVAHATHHPTHVNYQSSAADGVLFGTFTVLIGVLVGLLAITFERRAISKTRWVVRWWFPARWCKRLDLVSFKQSAILHEDLSAWSLNLVTMHDTYLHGVTMDHVTSSHLILERCQLVDLSILDARLDWLGLRASRLAKVDLSGTQFGYLSMRDCSAAGSTWKRAQLVGSYFSNCDLSGADLTGADLTGASFSNCDLSGANLSGANLSGANFWSTDLVDVVGLELVRGYTTMSPPWREEIPEGWERTSSGLAPLWSDEFASLAQAQGCDLELFKIFFEEQRTTADLTSILTVTRQLSR
jgi:uncharacterized protein YjbI with pentapeptide repeats